MAASARGILRLQLDAFPVLQTDSGSVRLAINPLRGGPPSGPTPNGQFYPVIINRAAATTYYALNSRCTHQGCVVEALDPGSNRMACLCHGSAFGIDGRRLAGPAGSALGRYTVNLTTPNSLEVEIPGLRYSVAIASVVSPNGGAGRLRLSFPALRNVSYEVQARQSLDAPGVPAPFASTADGAADQMVFKPTANTTANLYVERTAGSGFFTVAVVVSEV